MTQLEALFMIVGHRIGGGGAAPPTTDFKKYFASGFLTCILLDLKLRDGTTLG